MAKFQAPQIIPSPLPEDRFAQNDDLPSSSALRRAAWSINHASMYQRRMLFGMSNYTQSTPTPASTVQTDIYFCFRTGENVDSIAVHIGMAPAAAASGTNKAACILKIYDGTSTLVADPMYYPEVDTGGTYTPSQVSWNGCEIDLTDGLLPNTVYVGQIEQDYYSRIHSIMVYEKAANVGVSSETGVCNPLLWEANKPIYDAGIQDLLETGTKIWQHNGTQLLSWSRHTAATAPTITSTSYVNILGGAAAWASTTPGFQYGTLYHNTANGNVPVELGVRAVRTAGTGTLSIRLIQNGSTVLTKTGIDHTASYTPCDTSAHTILAHAPAKTDIMALVSNGTTTWRIDAIGLWEYEA